MKTMRSIETDGKSRSTFNVSRWTRSEKRSKTSQQRVNEQMWDDRGGDGNTIPSRGGFIEYLKPLTQWFWNIEEDYDQTRDEFDDFDAEMISTRRKKIRNQIIVLVVTLVSINPISYHILRHSFTCIYAVGWIVLMKTFTHKGRVTE
jgi:hypothetical protein